MSRINQITSFGFGGLGISGNSHKASCTPVPIQFVIVAGGGSGAQRWSGGGGAGGVAVGSVAAATKGTQYTITVGGGGATPYFPAPTICYAYTYRGVNSSAFCVTAIGGGGGKGYSCYIPSPLGSCVAPGGSGGGGGGPSGPAPGNAPFAYNANQGGSATQPGQPTPTSPAVVWTNYGYPGGNYNGGGGGASSAGSTRTLPGPSRPQWTTPGSAGGSGLTVSITGSPFVLAGGGGAGGLYGATQPTGGWVGGPGGPGGGGNGSGYGSTYPRLGSPTPLPGQNGGTNTGGGGGAGACRAPITPSIGGSGGSGVVYISVPTPQAGTAGPPSVFTSGPDGAGNTWYKFTSSGTYKV